MVKMLMQESQVQSLAQEDPWRRKWQPTPVFLPGRPPGQGSLMGYSAWGQKELDVSGHTGTQVDITFGLLQCGVCRQTPLFSCVLLISNSVGDHLFVLRFLHMYIRMSPYTYILIRMHTLCLT